MKVINKQTQDFKNKKQHIELLINMNHNIYMFWVLKLLDAGKRLKQAILYSTTKIILWSIFLMGLNGLQRDEKVQELTKTKHWMLSYQTTAILSWPLHSLTSTSEGPDITNPFSLLV